MQTVSTALYNAIKNGIGSTSGGITRDLLDLFEIYPATALPGVNGFDPDDAIERFAGIDITWNGNAYRRAVLSRSEISRHMGKTPNSVTVRFSNADENRYIATFATLNRVAGMWLVIRLISRSASVALTDSTILFAGKLDAPEGFDEIQGSLKASHHLGDLNFEFPPRSYQTDDPDGRSPSDPLNEGFPLVVISSNFTYQRSAPDKSYSRHDPRRYFATASWSSYDETPIGDPIPAVLGRAQLELKRLVFADRGTIVQRLDGVAMGRIEAILNMRMIYPYKNPTLGQPINVNYHYGDPGGTGTNLADPLFPTHGLFSNLAYVSYEVTGSNPERIDGLEKNIAVILGHRVTLPNASGSFVNTGWTDNGVYLTRHLLTDERYLNIDPAFIEDPVAWASGIYCDTPLYDESNTEAVRVPSSDFGDSRIIRYRSTGILDARGVLYNSYGSGDRPEVQQADRDEFDEFDPPPPETIVVFNYLRKRYTSNAPIVKRVKALDFLYNTWLPSFRGYLIQNGKGKIEIRVDKPADFTHLRVNTSVSATSISVLDVTPWIGNLQGLVNIGAHQVTSENRVVTGTAYTADANTLPLAAGASGTVTATASGATLTGGTSSLQATGTITIGGTPAAGNTVSATVAGYTATFTLGTEDTTATAAKLLADRINAHPQLQLGVVASWTTASPNVCTIKSKLGVLTLSSALAFAHTGALAAPTVAATHSAAAGSLPAGTYYFAYADRNANGSTTLSPVSSIVLSANQQAQVAATVFPAGVTSRDFYMSRYPNDTQLVFVTNRATSSPFSINALPAANAAPPPQYNTTGDEIIRIAKSYATNNQSAGILAQAGLTRGNIFADTYKWPLTQTAFNQIKAKFVSAKDDFAEVPYELNDKTLQASMGKTVPRELDLTAVDNLHQTRRIVNQEFAKHVDYNFGNSFSTNGEAILHEEGDVITSSDDSGGWVNLLTRIEQMSIDEDHNVKIKYARQYATRIYSDYVGRHSPTMPTVLAGLPPTETILRQVNMPVLRDTDTAALDAPGYYAAVSLPSSYVGYPGVTLWVDKGFGDTKVAEFPDEAIIGNGIAVLPDASGIDTANTLTVDLYRPFHTLPSGTADNPVEIIYGREHLAYETAVQIDDSPNRWELTTLHRKLSDTLGTGHLADDDFIVLNQAVQFIPVEEADINVPYNYKVVQGTGVEAALQLATPVSFTVTGANWLAPADVTNFAIDSISRGGVRLRWDKDGKELRTVTYRIERADGVGAWYDAAVVAGNTWTDHRLATQSVTHWRIVAQVGKTRESATPATVSLDISTAFGTTAPTGTASPLGFYEAQVTVTPPGGMNATGLGAINRTRIRVTRIVVLFGTVDSETDHWFEGGAEKLTAIVPMDKLSAAYEYQFYAAYEFTIGLEGSVGSVGSIGSATAQATAARNRIPDASETAIGGVTFATDGETTSLKAVQGNDSRLIGWGTASTVSITGATTLTDSAFGKTHICTGTTADYTITLPSVTGNAGKLIGLVMSHALTRLVTVARAGSATIGGATSRVMWAREGALLLCDGTNWLKVAGMTLPMTAFMRLSSGVPTAAQSVPNATMTKVLLNATDIDNTGLMGDTTNRRINVKRAGLYQLMALVYFSAPGAGTRFIVQPYKNTAIQQGGEASLYAAGGYPSPQISYPITLVSGDYVELHAYQNTGAAANLYGDPTGSSCVLSLIEVPAW